MRIVPREALPILLCWAAGAALFPANRSDAESLPALGGETQPGLVSVLSSQETTFVFDFEERDVHFEDLPMYWSKLAPGEGFPHYAYGRLDNTRSRSGSYSFLLVPDGGSLAYQYRRRSIPVRPGSDFELTGYVHLEGARNSRARLSCVLTDWRGDALPGSMHHSALVGPDDYSPDGWVEMKVYVPGNYPHARFIQPIVWLLQERQYRDDIIEGQEIIRHDVDVRAWFDDITIVQLPRVILRTERPGNVFAGHEPARLIVEVDGVSALDYQVTLLVRDAEGVLVAEESWVLSGVAGENRQSEIDLPGLMPGLYRSELQIISGNEQVATRRLTFAKLAPRISAAPSSGEGFGILQLDQRAGPWDTAMHLTQLCGARLVKVPVWRRRPELGGAIFSEPNFDRKLIALQQNSIELVATFSEVPDHLSRQLELGRSSLLDVLSSNIPWQTEVTTILAQYARQVPYWQIGPDIGPEELRWDPRSRFAVETLRREFEQLVGYSILAAPLSDMVQVTREEVGTRYAAMSISPAVTPAHIPQYLEDARVRGLDHIWATIYPLDGRHYSRSQVLIDFALRAAFAKVGRAEAVFAEHPWQARVVNARKTVEPTELLVVYRTLADLLGGAHYVGQFEIAPGVTALLFDREGEGCLMVWNERYDPRPGAEQVAYPLYLGEQPLAVDLFGNTAPLESHEGLSVLRPTNWPIFVTGINTRLALLRASVALDPPVVEASISSQQVTLSFINTFNSPISGRIRFAPDSTQPAQWTIDPSHLNFTLQPGERFEQATSIMFPRNELGGEKILEVFFTVEADRTYRLRVRKPFEIRLAGVDVGLFARRVGAGDLMIQLVVSNEAKEEISLVSFADLPDLNHLEQPIPRLMPGATATRTFVIPNAVQWLGNYIRVGLFDPRGTKRINYQVAVN